MIRFKKVLDFRIILLLLLVTILVFTALYKTGIIFGNRNKEDGVGASINGHISYNTDEAVKTALDNLSDSENTEKAELIRGYNASQRKVSITFCKMGTPSEMEQIVKLLKKYDISATFFLDAMSAAEDAETVQMICSAGYDVGNYGLSAEKYWDKMKQEDLVVSLAKGQAVLKTITGKEPVYFQGNATKYTDEVLHTARSAGLKSGIEATNFISDTSFPNFNAALGYISKISNGSIICVKIDDTLDEIEYEPFERDEKPAEDKKAYEPGQTEEEKGGSDIVTSVEYLLEALDATRTAVVQLDELNVEPDPMVDEFFARQENAAQYEIEQSDPVDSHYYEGALFIGDSLTQALANYSNIKDVASFCAYKSITPADIVNNVKAQGVDGKEVSVLDTIKNQTPSKIYILLGANSLTTGSDDSLVVYYERLLEILKTNFKDVPIYVQGLTPVTMKTSSEKVVLTNGRIKKVNTKLAKLAVEKKCYYIDLYSGLSDENGNLPVSIAQKDGIHLNESGCNIWVEYLSTHVVKD